MEDQNQNNDINNDPDENLDSWTFIEKIQTENSVEPIIYFKDDINYTSSSQELTEDDLGGFDSNSDSDTISIISENEDQECCMCALLKLQSENNNVAIKNNNKSNDLTFIEKLEAVQRVISYKKAAFFVLIGICFLATCFVWNNETEDKATEHDFQFEDMTLNDVLDDAYDKHLWIPYENSIPNNSVCEYAYDFSANNLNEFNPIFMQTYKRDNNDISMSVAEPLYLSNSFASPQILNINGNVEKLNDFDSNFGFDDEEINNEFNILKKFHKSIKNRKGKQTKKSLKIKENYLNMQDKCLSQKEKYLRKLEKEIKKLEAKLRKTYHRMKKELQKRKSFKVKELERKENIKINNNTSDWYQKMHFGRSEIRYKEKLSDWIFDRSKIRSNLRDESNFYLPEMVDSTYQNTMNSRKHKYQKRHNNNNWYFKMFLGRSNKRYKEKLSDWFFDRSKMRRTLRNKANWYFSRTDNREKNRSDRLNFKSRYAKQNIYKSYQF